MKPSPDAWTAHLLNRLRRVRQALDLPPMHVEPDTRFADAVDSMGMAELLALLAADCGASATAIEECCGRSFSTVAELGRAMHTAGLMPHSENPTSAGATPSAYPSARRSACWLAATAVRLPETVQSAAAIDAAIGRPAGWLEGHAGIVSRRTWAGQDPLTAAVEASQDCLEQAGRSLHDVSTLLVTAEAPPLLAGLAAALHHRLGLRSDAVALDIGGACTGFLAALWTARRLLAPARPVLVIAVEAHTQHLHLRPGLAGEAAALFGDAAAAALLTAEPVTSAPVPVTDVRLGADGGMGGLLRFEPSAGGVELHMDGISLAARAIRAMARAARELAEQYGLTMADLAAVVAHGGNGRMPELLARHLGLPPERVWSETSRTGNLGSATLPVAWTAHAPMPTGPVIWTAVGAGLTWGAALTGATG